MAGLLLATLMPFLAVKAFHVHETHEHSVCCEDSPSAQQIDDDCPICHFMLPPFVEAEAFHFCPSLPVRYFDPVSHPGEFSFTVLFSYYLRAPPVVRVFVRSS